MSWNFQKSSELGPSQWGKTFSNCISDNQSPINILSNTAKRCNMLCSLKMKYKKSKCNIYIKNNIPIINYDKGSTILYRDITYQLYQITIHTPSLHTIDNVQLCTELNLYHKTSNGGIVIISILVEENDRFSSSQDFFQQFIPYLKKNLSRPTNIPTDGNWNINQAIPNDKGFFLYKGSLPHPPCNEDITWIVFKNPVNIQRKNFKQLKNILIDKYNNRKVQPLNGRNIYFSNNERDIKNKQQVYVQCKKVNINDIDDDETPAEELLFKKQKKPNTISKTEENISGNNISNKYTIIIITIVFVIMAILGIALSLIIPIQLLDNLVKKLYQLLYILPLPNKK